jgi:hypothetical protein
MLARIYKPPKNAMQSGKALTKVWRLEFAPSSAHRPDALMGWSSGADPNEQVRIDFESKDAAIAFAREHGIPHQVIEPAETKPHIKSYSDNFAFRRREPWSH